MEGVNDRRCPVAFGAPPSTRSQPRPPKLSHWKATISPGLGRKHPWPSAPAISPKCFDRAGLWLIEHRQDQPYVISWKPAGKNPHKRRVARRCPNSPLDFSNKGGDPASLNKPENSQGKTLENDGAFASGSCILISRNKLPARRGALPSKRAFPRRVREHRSRACALLSWLDSATCVEFRSMATWREGVSGMSAYTILPEDIPTQNQALPICPLPLFEKT